MPQTRTAPASCESSERVNAIGTPEAAFRDLIAFDRKGGNDVIFNRHSITQAMKRHLSTGLAKDWVAAHSTGENVFDAEVFSGRQSTTKANEYQSIKLISNDGNSTKMQAVLGVTVDDAAHTNKQSFILVNEDGTWKLDDIEIAQVRPRNTHLIRSYEASYLHLRIKRPLSNDPSRIGGATDVRWLGET